MEITLSKVVEAARQRRAAVTAEGGGYIVLLALQQLAASPREVTADLVGLTAGGEIELGPSPAAQPREVEAQLRQLLADLLCLPQSAPPALKATGERAAVGDLAALEAELTAALIPFNHAAARRTLARLFRETQKAARAVPSADLAEREASTPLSGAPSPVGSGLPPPSASLPAPSLPAPRSSKAATLAAAPQRALTPLPAAEAQRALTPLPAAPQRALTPLPAAEAQRALTPLPAAAPLRSTPALPAVEPPVQVAPSPPPPPPVAVLALPELEIDVEIVLSGADARLDVAAVADADPPVPSRMGEGEAAEVNCATAEGVAAPRSDEPCSEVPATSGVGASEAATTSPRATPLPVVAAEAEDIVDIEVDELDELDELLTAETPPTELRFTSLSSALVVESDDQALLESPLPDPSALVSYAEPEPEPPPYRSDLGDLLEGYLSHTRCEEQMTADLRRMIGLEPWRAPGAAIHRTELGR
jgi:hypothetical protein